MEKGLDKYQLDTLEQETVYIELVRTVFVQAYREGRADGANGIFIDCNRALQIFLEREDNQCSVWTSFKTLNCISPDLI